MFYKSALIAACMGIFVQSSLAMMRTTDDIWKSMEDGASFTSSLRVFRISSLSIEGALWLMTAPNAEEICKKISAPLSQEQINNLQKFSASLSQEQINNLKKRIFLEGSIQSFMEKNKEKITLSQKSGSLSICFDQEVFGLEDFPAVVSFEIPEVNFSSATFIDISESHPTYKNRLFVATAHQFEEGDLEKYRIDIVQKAEKGSLHNPAFRSVGVQAVFLSKEHDLCFGLLKEAIQDIECMRLSSISNPKDLLSQEIVTAGFGCVSLIPSDQKVSAYKITDGIRRVGGSIVKEIRNNSMNNETGLKTKHPLEYTGQTKWAYMRSDHGFSGSGGLIWVEDHFELIGVCTSSEGKMGSGGARFCGSASFILKQVCEGGYSPFLKYFYAFFAEKTPVSNLQEFEEAVFDYAPQETEDPFGFFLKDFDEKRQKNRWFYNQYSVYWKGFIVNPQSYQNEKEYIYSLNQKIQESQENFHLKSFTVEDYQTHRDNKMYVWEKELKPRPVTFNFIEPKQYSNEEEYRKVLTHRLEETSILDPERIMEGRYVFLKPHFEAFSLFLNTQGENPEGVFHF